jgi:hypothetical protein
VGKNAIVNHCILLTGSCIERESVVRKKVLRGRKGQDGAARRGSAEYWAMRTPGQAPQAVRTPMPAIEPVASLTERS